MLGLIHHLLVSERASLDGVIELLRSFAAPRALVEWVEQEDPRFRQIAGIHSGLYEGLTRKRFEEALLKALSIERQEQLPSGTRTLYECRAKQA
jgi:hypothetical protein